MTSSPEKKQRTGKWAWMIAGVLILLVFGFLFTQSPAPSFSKLSPDGIPEPIGANDQVPFAELSLVGTYETPEGVQVRQFSDVRDQSQQVIRLYNPSERANTVQLIVEVSKSFAESAADLSFEGIEKDQVVVLEDDPVLLFPVLTLLANEEYRDIVVKTAKKELNLADHYMPLYSVGTTTKITPSNYRAARSQGAVVSLEQPSSSPTPSPRPLLAQKSVRLLDLTDEGYARFKPRNEGGYGKVPLRDIPYPVEEFTFGPPELQPGALLSLRYQLPSAVSNVPRQVDFQLSDDSEKYAKIKKISDPVPVPGSNKRLWDFDVLIELRPDLRKAKFPDLPPIKAHLTPFIPENLELLYAHEELAKKAIDAISPNLQSRKGFDFVIEFKGHADSLHAGYFLNYQLDARQYVIHPNVLFLTNNFRDKKPVMLNFCDRDVQVPAGAYAVPFEPVRTCDLKFKGETIQQFTFNDVNNFAASYEQGGVLAGYGKDLFCAPLITTLTEFRSYFDRQLAAIEPYSYEVLVGPTFAWTGVFRTGADIEDARCKLPEGFEGLTLKEGRAYALTFSADVKELYPSPKVSVSTIDAEPKLKSVLAKSWWQDKLDEYVIEVTPA